MTCLIYLRMAQANRHDSITTVFALRIFTQFYPNLKFRNFLADGAMDSYSIYELLDSYDMIPFISLDSRTKSNMKSGHPDVVCFDNKGRPVCRGGGTLLQLGILKASKVSNTDAGLPVMQKSRHPAANVLKALWQNNLY